MAFGTNTDGCNFKIIKVQFHYHFPLFIHNGNQGFIRVVGRLSVLIFILLLLLLLLLLLVDQFFYSPIMDPIELEDLLKICTPGKIEMCFVVMVTINAPY